MGATKSASSERPTGSTRWLFPATARSPPRTTLLSLSQQVAAQKAPTSPTLTGGERTSSNKSSRWAAERGAVLYPPKALHREDEAEHRPHGEDRQAGAVAGEGGAVVVDGAQHAQVRRERQDEDDFLQPLRRVIDAEIDAGEEHQREEDEVRDRAVGLDRRCETRQREAHRQECRRPENYQRGEDEVRALIHDVESEPGGEK